MDLHAVFQMVRMSTGHMEGDLQPLYVLLTDCYIYLLRKGQQTLLKLLGHNLFVFVFADLCHWFSGAAEKPYCVEEAVSYNELDYISVSR